MLVNEDRQIGECHRIQNKLIVSSNYWIIACFNALQNYGSFSEFIPIWYFSILWIIFNIFLNKLNLILIDKRYLFVIVFILAFLMIVFSFMFGIEHTKSKEEYDKTNQNG